MDFREVRAVGKNSPNDPFGPLTVKRGAPGNYDVQIEIRYCGVCHADVHYANDDLGVTTWPLVPGHEIAGIVTARGDEAGEVFSVGDRVGVGCIVESCLQCKSCAMGDEQYCERGMTWTYNDRVKHGLIESDTGITYGGYSRSITVHRRFVVRIPDEYPLEAAGPIFCAGVSMYSPLVRWGALNGGLRVGVVGIGGLGQMGLRLAASMGNEVVAISSSPNKREEALKMGASDFLLSTEESSLSSWVGKLDLILNTVSVDHQVSTYLPLLAIGGTILQLGIVSTPHSIHQASLMFRRLSVSGNIIGGVAATQECIDFCAERGVVPDCRVVAASELDAVYSNLAAKNDSVKRFVLDCGTIGS